VETIAVGIKKREPDGDLRRFIAGATCLANGLVMATNNVRHFEPARRFGLEIENPLA